MPQPWLPTICPLLTLWYFYSCSNDPISTETLLIALPYRASDNLGSLYHPNQCRILNPPSISLCLYHFTFGYSFIPRLSTSIPYPLNFSQLYASSAPSALYTFPSLLHHVSFQLSEPHPLRDSFTAVRLTPPYNPAPTHISLGNHHLFQNLFLGLSLYYIMPPSSILNILMPPWPSNPYCHGTLSPWSPIYTISTSILRCLPGHPILL